MTLAEQLIELCDHGDWRERARSMCKDGGLEDEKEIKKVLGALERRLASLRGLAEDIGDPLDEPDLRNALVYWYVEVKCEWCQTNQRLNYQTMMRGAPDLTLMMIGGLTTLMYTEVERILGQAETEAITDFLASPSEVSQELNENRLLRIQAGHCEVPSDLLDDVRQALMGYEHFQFLLDSALREVQGASGVMSEYEGLVKNGQAALTGLNDLRIYLKPIQKRVVDRAAEARLKILQNYKLSKDVELTERSKTLIVSFAEQWIDEVFARGVEPDAVERIRAGKGGHVTLNFQLNQDDYGVQLTISDDGKGISRELVETLCILNNHPIPAADEEDLSFLTRFAYIPEEVAGEFGVLLHQLAEGGRIRLLSPAGQGCKVTFIVPHERRIEARNYVVVRARDYQLALDAEGVQSLATVKTTDLQARYSQPKLVLHGVTHEVGMLADLIENSTTSWADLDDRNFYAVAMERSGMHIALLVDGVTTFERGIARPFEDGVAERPAFLDGVLKVGGATAYAVSLEALFGDRGQEACVA